MPFLIDDEWARRLPKMWRWMRSFRIDGPGVSAKNTDETFTASITQPKTNTNQIATVIPAKLTSAVSGRVGWYNAKSAKGKAKSDATGDLAETDITPAWADADDLLVMYVPDLGQAVASIDDFTSSNLNQIVVEGLVVGSDTATGRRIVMVASAAGSSLPVGQYQYMVYQVTASNVAGWDFTRAHP